MHYKLYGFVVGALLLYSCKPGDNKQESSVPQINLPNIQVQDSIVPSGQTTIPQHLPEYMKAGLTQLQGFTPDSDGIAGQLLDFVRSGHYVLDEKFKFIFFRFKPNSAEFEEKNIKEIEDFAQALTAFPRIYLTINSYTNGKEISKKNEILTQKRADAIKTFLVERGVDAARLTTMGYGNKYPVGDHKTLEGQLLNDRIEIMITRY